MTHDQQPDLFEDLDTPDECLETAQELRRLARTLNQDPSILTDAELPDKLRSQVLQDRTRTKEQRP
jgi:hypothetical protein